MKRRFSKHAKPLGLLRKRKSKRSAVQQPAMINRSFKIPERLHVMLKAEARKRGTTKSAVARKVLEAYIAKLG